MNCQQVRQHWELYYDSEGDAELYLQINEHLAACPACAKWFFQQSQLEDMLAAKLRAGAPTKELWEGIHAQCGLTARAATSRSWLFFGSLAVAAVLLLSLGVWGFFTWTASDLAALASVRHERLVEGAEAVEFVSRSDREVERYLKRRVSFPVRCPPRGDAGFLVRGGGVCQMAGEPAAYVIGEVDGHDVTVFILPADRLSSFTREREALRQQMVHHRRQGQYEMVLAQIDRNLVMVIGRGLPERLERVVRAYGTYPEPEEARRAANKSEPRGLSPRSRRDKPERLVVAFRGRKI